MAPSELALMNIAEIEASLKEMADKPFSPSEFPFEFLAAYDAPKATVTKLRQASHPQLLDEPGQIHWKKKLLYRSATAGQAGAVLEGMAQQFEARRTRRGSCFALRTKSCSPATPSPARCWT